MTLSRSRRTLLSFTAACLCTVSAGVLGDAFGYTGGLAFGGTEILNQGRPGSPLAVQTQPSFSIIRIEPWGLTTWVSCYLGIAMVSFLLTWLATGGLSSNHDDAVR